MPLKCQESITRAYFPPNTAEYLLFRKHSFTLQDVSGGSACLTWGFLPDGLHGQGQGSAWYVGSGWSQSKRGRTERKKHVETHFCELLRCSQGPESCLPTDRSPLHWPIPTHVQGSSREQSPNCSQIMAEYSVPTKLAASDDANNRNHSGLSQGLMWPPASGLASQGVHFLAILSSPSMNTGVPESFRISFLPRIYPGIAGSYASS